MIQSIQGVQQRGVLPEAAQSASAPQRKMNEPEREQAVGRVRREEDDKLMQPQEKQRPFNGRAVDISI
ncbi:MAG: hypothetical protein AB1633_13705 [Elusimicrobiota bacterium]